MKEGSDIDSIYSRRGPFKVRNATQKSEDEN